MACQCFALQRAQTNQQVLSLCISGCRRYIKPNQLARCHAPTPQLQRQPGEIRRKNFRTAVSRQLFVLILRPQAIAHTRFQSPCPARALGSTGLGNTLGVEAGHAAARIESRYPRQPGVDHHPHAVDGQAGLGDVGGQHHFALTRRRRINRRPLRGEVELTVQWAEQDLRVIAQRIGQLLMHATDLGLPRQEHQHTAGFVVQGFEDGLHQPWLDELACLEWPAPAHRHRVHAPFAAQDRRIVEQSGQPFAFQGGRHQEDFQRLIVTEQFPAIEAQGQRQVGVETALSLFATCLRLSKRAALPHSLGLTEANEGKKV